MEFSIHNLQKYKLAVHIFQGILMLITFILDIIVFRSSAVVDARLSWNFGLIFLTIPAIIYLTMTPRFPRTKKFANPYALVIIDFIYCILWLSAFASVANWNGTGKCNDGCRISRGVVATGVFLWFAWILSTAMSVYGCMYYRREGYLPGASRAPNNAAMIDPDKEAFSTAPHDDEYAPVHNADEHELHDDGFPRGSIHSHTPDYAASSYGGAYRPPTAHEESTAYTGYSESDYDSHNSRTGRAQFPSANYDNIPVLGEP